MSHFERALEIYEAIAPRSAPLGAVLIDLGTAHRQRGSLDLALSYFARALDIGEAIAPMSMETGRALNNVGLAHRDLGNRDLALSYFEQADEITKAATDTPATSFAVEWPCCVEAFGVPVGEVDGRFNQWHPARTADPLEGPARRGLHHRSSLGRDLGAIGRAIRGSDGQRRSTVARRKSGYDLRLQVTAQRAGDENRTRVLSLGS